MKKNLPKDVDLTIKMDFCSKEKELKSVHIPKSAKDESYKRYNVYKRENPFTSTESFDSSFITPSFHSMRVTSTSTSGTLTPSFFDDIINKDTIRVEERVCWRKLYKDPEIYEHSKTPEECVEYIKDLNFPLGSKYDRIKYKQEFERIKSGFSGGRFCDCCGKPLNLRNCFAHKDNLCSDCNREMATAVRSVRIS